jgi:hypothetical protein
MAQWGGALLDPYQRFRPLPVVPSPLEEMGKNRISGEKHFGVVVTQSLEQPKSGTCA